MDSRAPQTHAHDDSGKQHGAAVALPGGGSEARSDASAGREDLARNRSGTGPDDRPKYTCPRCRRSLPRLAYSTDKHGDRRLTCATCCRQVRQLRAAAEVLRMQRLAKGCPTKKCARCLMTKPITDFYTHKLAKDGRRPKCKACDKAYSRERQLPASLTQDGRVLADNAGRPFRVQALCGECGSLPWRVEGSRCPACGLEAGVESTLRVEDFGGIASSASLAVAEAPGDTGLASGLGRRSQRKRAKSFTN